MGAEVTTMITNTITIFNSLIAFGEPLVNPLHAQANIFTYLVDLGVIMPLGLKLARKLLAWARGGGGKRR